MLLAVAVPRRQRAVRHPRADRRRGGAALVVAGRPCPYGHPDAPVEVRVGPNGPTGIVRLPLPRTGRPGPRPPRVTDVHRRRSARGTTSRRVPDGADTTSWPTIPAEPDRPPLPDQSATAARRTRGSRSPATWRDALASGELADFEQRTGITVTYERLGADPAAEDVLASTGLPRATSRCSDRPARSARSRPPVGSST